MYEHLQLKPADIKFLRENMVSRTASVVTNGPGCSDAASLLAETHLKDKISSAWNGNLFYARIYATFICSCTRKRVRFLDSNVQPNLFGLNGMEASERPTNSRAFKTRV